MSEIDTNIYNRPHLQTKSAKPPRRKRRSSSRRKFDDHSGRKRHSRNSGSRRLLHLYRKGDVQKRIWWTLLVLIVLGLVALAIWQFWYLDHVEQQLLRQHEMSVESEAE